MSRKAQRERELQEKFTTLMSDIFRDPQYKGQHVALNVDAGVVAHSDTPKEVAQAVRDKGMWGSVTFTYVPDGLHM